MTCTRLKILLFPSLTQRSIITFFCILIVLPASFGDGFYGGVPSEVCTRTYICGLNTWGIWYPFWGDGRPSYCGIEGLELKCQNNEYPIIESETQRFRVSNIYTSIRRMTFSRDDLWDSYCPGILNETTFNKNLFKYTSNVTLLDLFYDCSDAVPLNESNSINCSQGTGFYTNPSNLLQLPNLTSTCKKSIEVPFLSTALQDYLQNRTDFQQALTQGFEVEFQADYTTCTQCFSSGGLCGSNTTSKFVCYCNDQPNTLTCDYSAGSGLMTRMKISIGIGAATAAITVICIICWLFRSKISSIMASLWKRENNDQDIEAIIRNYEPLAIKRYSLPEVKKMTNSFKDKLGQGGYGAVYKGKLKDGHLVAVKLLNTSKRNGKEFINEVATISKTCHVNVVTLLGFCIDSNKRALIYEFMPNGSLEKFIYNKDSLKASRQLGWEKLYQIALGIANGLEYLHRGCNARILHLDIKPHNILLDEEFGPKISDFGLAKLCPRKESIVSMSGARGTIGYIAPEVFSRNFGEVSHKSDVYSYGMLVLEMVGGKKNPQLGVENASEVYFPEWIYRHFELGKEFKLHDAMTGEENEIAKRMIIIGLWCIQTRPLDRPSMNKVIDMLQGSIETLHVPPNPCLFPPSSATVANVFTISTS
ncbi:hypothetical protein ACOSP7_025909 [Xanthoceras sorbifolium]